MTVTFTKVFEFSASHAQAEKVVGHNYRLRVTALAADTNIEPGFSEKVETALIKKIHSRDLGLHVDFLKGVPLDDLSLLKAFWRVLEPTIRPTALHSLSLERDPRTQWTITGAP